MRFRISSLRWARHFKEDFLNVITRVLMILVFTLVSGVVVAESHIYKIGFVNTARVLKEAPQARRVEERLKAEFEPRQAQIKELREEIIAIEELLKSTDNSISVNTKRKNEREIRLKVSQLKFLEREFREDQNLRRNEEIRKLQQVIAAVLEQLGDSGSYDLILTEGVSYVSGQIDITTQIIEMLKSQAETTEDVQ
jgi:outer membrane protein